jgi:hypothetical protein
MQIVTINAGCTFNSGIARKVLVSTLSRVAPSWGLAFGQEADGKRKSLENDGKWVELNSSMLRMRWWPGEGSFAQSILLQKWLRPHLLGHKIVGRSVATLFSFQAGYGALLGNVVIGAIGLHAKSGEDIVITISELLELLAWLPKGAKVLLCGDWNLDILKLNADVAPSLIHHDQQFWGNWLALQSFIEVKDSPLRKQPP